MGKRQQIKKGDKYNMWSVIKEVDNHVTKGGNKFRRFLCVCDCGTKRTVLRRSFVSGNSKSCGCKPMSEEGRKKLSESHVGYKMPQSQKNNIRKAMKKVGAPWMKTDKMRKVMSERFSRYNKGKIEEDSPSWKGNLVGYFGLHSWIRKKLGQPDTCKQCSKSGLTSHQIHWANISHEYKRDINDWIRLCVSCHRRYDQDSFNQ